MSIVLLDNLVLRKMGCKHCGNGLKQIMIGAEVRQLRVNCAVASSVSSVLGNRGTASAWICRICYIFGIQ